MSLVGDTRTAALYRLDPDLTVTRVLPGLSISNGLGWSPDDRSCTTWTRPRGGSTSTSSTPRPARSAGRRAAIAVAPEQGRPDGLAVDAEGGIWVALWGGGAVQRYTPGGSSSDARLELPVSQVTSCCFGDPDLATLYVTSAARGAEHEPLAGSLFCLPSRSPRDFPRRRSRDSGGGASGQARARDRRGVGIGQAIARELALQGAGCASTPRPRPPDETLASSARPARMPWRFAETSLSAPTARASWTRPPPPRRP